MSSILDGAMNGLRFTSQAQTESAIVSEAPRQTCIGSGDTSKLAGDEFGTLDPREYVNKGLDTYISDMAKIPKDGTKRRSNQSHGDPSSSSSSSNDLDDVDRTAEEAKRKTLRFDAETRRVLRPPQKYHYSKSNPASRMPKRSSSKLMDLETEHEKHLFGVSRKPIAKVYRDANNIRTVKRRVVDNTNTKPMFLSVYSIERKYLPYDELAERLKQLPGFLAISHELEHRQRSFYNVECLFEARHFNGAFHEISSWKCDEDKLNVVAGRSA